MSARTPGAASDTRPAASATAAAAMEKQLVVVPCCLVQSHCFSIAIKAVFLALAPLGLVSLWLAVFADMGTSSWSSGTACACTGAEQVDLARVDVGRRRGDGNDLPEARCPYCAAAQEDLPRRGMGYVEIDVYATPGRVRRSRSSRGGHGRAGARRGPTRCASASAAAEGSERRACRADGKRERAGPARPAHGG